jgi:hypothetical protein
MASVRVFLFLSLTLPILTCRNSFSPPSSLAVHHRISASYSFTALQEPARPVSVEHWRRNWRFDCQIGSSSVLFTSSFKVKPTLYPPELTHLLTLLLSSALRSFPPLSPSHTSTHSYQSGRLIEINSHSLFSKWFSESGKLVQRLFAQVTEMVDDEGCFVVVLIGALLTFPSSSIRSSKGEKQVLTRIGHRHGFTDEVESLTAARAGAMSGKEPSDALRVRLLSFPPLAPVSRSPLPLSARSLYPSPVRPPPSPADAPFSLRRSSMPSSPNSTSSSRGRTASS